MINASEYMPKIPGLQLPLDQITEAEKTHPPLITFRFLNPHQDSPALFGIHSPAPKPLHAFPSPFIEVQSFSHSPFLRGSPLSFFQEGQPPVRHLCGYCSYPPSLSFSLAAYHKSVLIFLSIPHIPIPPCSFYSTTWILSSIFYL